MSVSVVRLFPSPSPSPARGEGVNDAQWSRFEGAIVISSSASAPMHQGVAMIELSVLVESLGGLTWPTWKRLVEVVESSGFAGLFCSDHFTVPGITTAACWS